MTIGAKKPVGGPPNIRTEDLNTSLSNNFSPVHRKTIPSHQLNGGPMDYLNTSNAINPVSGVAAASHNPLAQRYDTYNKNNALAKRKLNV